MSLIKRMFDNNLPMMPANSVAASIFMLIIAYSLICPGSSVISSENAISQSPTQMMNNSKISTIPPNQSDGTTNIALSSILKLENNNINLSTHVTLSCISQIESYEKYLKTQLADEVDHQRNITRENFFSVINLSLELIKISEKLYNSQEKITNMTNDYNQLNNKYIELKKSTAETAADKEKIKAMDDEIKSLKFDNQNLENYLSNEKENYTILFNEKTLLDNNLTAKQLEIKDLNNKLFQLGDTLEKVESQNQEKIKAMDDEIKSLKFDNQNLENYLSKEKENYTILFNEKTLLDNKLTASQSEIADLNNKLFQLKDTLEKVSQNQKEILANYSEINNKYKESEKLVQSLKNQQINLEKNLKTAKLDLEKKDESVNLLEVKVKEIIDEKNNTEIQLKGVNNTLQSMIFSTNETYSNILEILNTLVPILKFNDDNAVPDDLLKKRRQLYLKEYDENQIRVVNDIKTLFDNFALTSANHQCPNKYFCNKKISFYDSGICKLISENIPGIDISRRNLYVVPKDLLSCLGDLEKINLWDNQLNYLESGTFNNLSKLEFLHIDNNHLTTLPRDIFNGLEKLRVLDLSSNRLNCLEPSTFNGLLNLEELLMYNNHLTTLPKDIFNGLEKLEHLYLSSNRLNHLEPNTFNGLLNLSVLYMENNYLTTLAKDIFNELEKLEDLYLYANRLNHLEPSTFNGLSNLRVLNIRENDLRFSRDEFLEKYNLEGVDYVFYD